MMSSMMGAIAFQKGLGLTHSCAHALGTVADMHHGLANGIMIDHALKHNVQAVPERFTTMATTIAATVGLQDTSPQGFLGWLGKLKAETGIPAKLSDAGIKKDQLGKLVEIAVADSCHGNNPRVCTREDFVKIFNEAF
jgi:alcohol dehydrogenase class IV